MTDLQGVVILNIKPRMETTRILRSCLRKIFGLRTLRIGTTYYRLYLYAKTCILRLQYKPSSEPKWLSRDLLMRGRVCLMAWLKCRIEGGASAFTWKAHFSLSWKKYRSWVLPSRPGRNGGPRSGRSNVKNVFQKSTKYENVIALLYVNHCGCSWNDRHC